MVETATAAPSIDTTKALPVERDISKEPHNLSVLNQNGKLLLVINLTVPSILSKNNKPMLATSRGFVKVGDFRISLNIMDDRKAGV